MMAITLVSSEAVTKPSPLQSPTHTAPATLALTQRAAPRVTLLAAVRILANIAAIRARLTIIDLRLGQMRHCGCVTVHVTPLTALPLTSDAFFTRQRKADMSGTVCSGHTSNCTLKIRPVGTGNRSTENTALRRA
jgi:hypothetical protein